MTLEKTADGYEVEYSCMPDALIEPNYENATYAITFYHRIKHLPIETLERYLNRVKPKGFFNKMSYQSDTKRKIRCFNTIHVLCQKKAQQENEKYKQLLLFRV